MSIYRQSIYHIDISNRATWPQAPSGKGKVVERKQKQIWNQWNNEHYMGACNIIFSKKKVKIRTPHCHNSHKRGKLHSSRLWACKKTVLFGTLSQTSDPTHPPRAFGTKWKIKVKFILLFRLFGAFFLLKKWAVFRTKFHGFVWDSGPPPTHRHPYFGTKS